MRANTRYKLQEVFFIVLFWIGAGNVFVLIRYYGTHYEIEELGIGKMDYIFIWATLASLGIGTIMGLLEIFIYPWFIRKKSFATSIIYRVFFFLLLLLTSIIAIVIISSYQKGYTIQDGISFSIQFLQSASFLSLLVYMALISTFLDLVLLINRRFGPGIILNILKGKYHHPREEHRIFMFLDLQSSSKIAESLGHINFSVFLQDCFNDLSDILLTYEASIYQFVGDEVVLTWPTKKGIRGANCIKIFFEFNQLLNNKSSYYISEYGYHPNFKASLNSGLVTVAEVGDIKSEIAYHGDVLNTAARVQDLCNMYGKKLLITKSIANRLDGNAEVIIEFIDEVELKGKENKEKIYSVELKNG